jgi:membrane protein required for beta-lactamase induction
LSWDISAAQLVAKAGRAAGEMPPPVMGEAGVDTLDQLWQLLVRAAVVWYAGYAVWVLFF